MCVCVSVADQVGKARPLRLPVSTNACLNGVAFLLLPHLLAWSPETALVGARGGVRRLTVDSSGTFG